MQPESQRITDNLSADKQALIEREANYFRHNAARMEYQACREAGWPIGSGAVGSGCKLFKQRFGGSGMRWSRQGAINLMPLRAAVMGNGFDQLWRSISLSSCPKTKYTHLHNPIAILS